MNKYLHNLFEINEYLLNYGTIYIVSLNALK